MVKQFFKDYSNQLRPISIPINEIDNYTAKSGEYFKVFDNKEALNTFLTIPYNKKFIAIGNEVVIVDRTGKDLDSVKFHHKSESIKETDANTQKNISEGFIYKGKPISLSIEAQMNWEALAIALLIDINKTLLLKLKESNTEIDLSDLSYLDNMPTFFGDGIEITTLDNEAYYLTKEDLFGFLAGFKTKLGGAIKAGRDKKLEILNRNQ